MAERAVHTVIFLGAQRTDRVDLGRAPSYPVIAQHHELAVNSDDPVLRTEAALASSSKPGKLVCIIWEGATAQMLDMPSGVVDGLEREQLAESLSYEAEHLSGIPASESAIDGISQRNPIGALPDYRRYWVTQIPSSIVSRLEEAVIRAGAKLAGVSHPGGLPRETWETPAPEATRREWRRVELWDQLTFALQGRADGSIETRVIRSAPFTKAWLGDLPTSGPLSWIGPLPVAPRSAGSKRLSDSLLLDTDGKPLEPTKIIFPTDGAPVEWLRAWAAELTSQPRRVPAVYSHSRVAPNRKFYITGGLAAAFALAIVGAHSTFVSMRTADIKSKADHQTALRLQMAPKDESAKEVRALTLQTEPFKAQLAELDGKISTLSTERDRRQKLVTKVTAEKAYAAEFQTIHRPAIAELLAALADSEKIDKSSDVVVKEVRKQESGELLITGLCRQSAFADAVATRLESRLGKAGWKVGAAQKHLRDDGLAFEYSIVLTPAVLSDSASSRFAGGKAHPATQPAPDLRNKAAQTADARIGASRS